MKVNLLTKINAIQVDPRGRPPARIVFSHVDKVIAEEEDLIIDYRITEKVEMQQVKVPIDELFEATIEF